MYLARIIYEATTGRVCRKTPMSESRLIKLEANFLRTFFAELLRVTASVM